MSVSCDIIKDLLPLYHDGVSSEESKKIIEKHLEDCNECKNYLNGISKEVFSYKNKSKEDEAKIHSLIKLRQKFRIKNIVIWAVSILCVVIFLFTAYNFIRYYEIPIPYSENILSSENVYSAYDIISNHDYYFTHVLFKDFEGQLTAYIYYTNVLLNNSSSMKITRIWDYNYINFTEYAGDRDFYKTISAIYYFIGDYNKLMEMSDEEFFTVVKDAVLIWER